LNNHVNDHILIEWLWGKKGLNNRVQ